MPARPPRRRLHLFVLHQYPFANLLKGQQGEAAEWRPANQGLSCGWRAKRNVCVRLSLSLSLYLDWGGGKSKTLVWGRGSRAGGRGRCSQLLSSSFATVTAIAAFRKGHLAPPATAAAEEEAATDSRLMIRRVILMPPPPPFSDLPRASLKFGSTLDPSNIKEKDDVYFECEIKAKPWVYKIEWKFEVSQ